MHTRGHEHLHTHMNMHRCSVHTPLSSSRFTLPFLSRALANFLSLGTPPRTTASSSPQKLHASGKGDLAKQKDESQKAQAEEEKKGGSLLWLQPLTYASKQRRMQSPVQASAIHPGNRHSSPPSSHKTYTMHRKTNPQDCRATTSGEQRTPAGSRSNVAENGAGRTGKG